MATASPAAKPSFAMRTQMRPISTPSSPVAPRRNHPRVARGAPGSHSRLVVSKATIQMTTASVIATRAMPNQR